MGPSCTAGGTQNGAAIAENDTATPQNTKMELRCDPARPLPSTRPKELKRHLEGRGAPTTTAALLPTAEGGTSKCPRRPERKLQVERIGPAGVPQGRLRPSSRNISTLCPRTTSTESFCFVSFRVSFHFLDVIFNFILFKSFHFFILSFSQHIMEENLIVFKKISFGHTFPLITSHASCNQQLLLSCRRTWT